MTVWIVQELVLILFSKKSKQLSMHFVGLLIPTYDSSGRLSRHAISRCHHVPRPKIFCNAIWRKSWQLLIPGMQPWPWSICANSSLQSIDRHCPTAFLPLAPWTGREADLNEMRPRHATTTYHLLESYKFSKAPNRETTCANYKDYVALRRNHFYGDLQLSPQGWWAWPQRKLDALKS